VTARDTRTGRITSSLTQIADEGDVGRPVGISPLGLAGAGAVAEAATAMLQGSPSRQMGDMCVKVSLRELRTPMRFCNSYAIDGQVANALAGAATTDMTNAITVLDSYRFGTLHPTAVEVGLRARAGIDQAFITGARAAGHVRRGHKLRVRLTLRHTGTGARTTRTIAVRIPLDTPRGRRTLRLTGTPSDLGGDPNDPGDLTISFDAQDTGEDPGPRSVAALRAAFEALGRFDGVSATIAGGAKHEAFRDPKLRITGSARVRVTVRP
jgi:hypothetical protein